MCKVRNYFVIFEDNSDPTKTKDDEPCYRKRFTADRKTRADSDAVERQLENFRRGFPFLKVVRAASPGDGVMVVGDAEAAAAVARYEREADRLGIVEIRASLGCRDPYVQELSGLSTRVSATKGHRHVAGQYRALRSGRNSRPCLRPMPTTRQPCVPS